MFNQFEKLRLERDPQLEFSSEDFQALKINRPQPHLSPGTLDSTDSD